MRLLNAQTEQVEQLPSIAREAVVSVYGPPPEEHFRLEQLFPYCIADVFIRYMEMKGGQVKSGEDWHVLENMYGKHAIDMMKSLNIRPLTLRQTEETASQINAFDYIFLQPDCDVPQKEPSEEKRPFSQFWLQTAGMSYSRQKTDALHNSPVLVSDLLHRYSPNAIRLYLAQQHYRRPWVYDEIALKRATHYVGKLNAAMNTLNIGDLPINLEPVQRRFTKAMDNDFDTLKGVASLLNLADEILFRAPNGYSIAEAKNVLRRLASIFGLQLSKPQ